MSNYITTGDLKAAFDTGDMVVDEAVYSVVCEAASRQIDTHCGRRFYSDDAVSARWYFTEDDDCVQVDDFSTTTGLVVAIDNDGDGTTDVTLASTYYFACPINGVDSAGRTVPYNEIRTRYYTLPIDDDMPRIKVTAKWGWATVPAEVKHATLLQAVQLLKSLDAPFGVADSNLFGAVRLQSRIHPTAQALLADYVRTPYGVA